jgi:hypothetical protein
MAERDPLAVGVKLATIEQLDCGCSKFEQLLPAEKSPALAPCKEITGESGNAPMSDRVTGIGALKVPTLTVPKLMLFTETVNAVLGVGRNTTESGTMQPFPAVAHSPVAGMAKPAGRKMPDKSELKLE